MWKTPHQYLSNKIDIHLIGCGGTGSFICAELSMLNELLHRLGHEGISVIAWDSSPVRDANLGRQRFRFSDLGVQKSVALISHEQAFNGFFDWKAEGDFVPKNGVSKYGNPKIVITAVDKPSVRFEFGSWFSKQTDNNVLWIDAGNDHQTGQVILGGAGLPTVFDLFGSQYKDMKDDSRKSCSSEEALARQDFGVNSMAARLVGQLIWNMLRHGQLEHHGAFFDVNGLSVSSLKVDPTVWRSYGYEKADGTKALN
jgi:PRTRC genetic system ThiF family protein